MLVLGSIDAELRRDTQLEGTQLRFKAHGSGQDQLAALGIPELEASYNPLVLVMLVLVMRVSALSCERLHKNAPSMVGLMFVGINCGPQLRSLYQAEYCQCQLPGPVSQMQASQNEHEVFSVSNFLQDRPPADTPWEESLLPPWPLFRSLRAKNVSCILITAFASEGGGNAQDAVAMASTIQTLLKADSHTLNDAAIPSHQWQFPVSWAHVFGRPADMSAY